MKLEQIESTYTVLSSLLEKEMPIRLSYKFSKIFNAISDEYEFYTKKIQTILSKYAQKDENGEYIINNGQIPFIPEFAQQAMQEVEELKNIEAGIPNITFSLDELESLSLSPAQVNTILPFITEE